MWKNKNIASIFQVITGMILVFAAIGFVEKKQKKKIVTEVIINIEEQYENFFIDESDVLAIATDKGTTPLKGSSVTDLKLRSLEEKIKQERFIKDVELYKDLKGNLLIKAIQRRPVARILHSSGQDLYIATDGSIMNVSEKYTSRVLLLSGKFFKNIGDTMYESQDSEAIMNLINFIVKDDFWRAQIAQLIIDKKGDIKMYTQVSKQYVEFGKTENIESKFKKLKIFYRDILPRKGWNTYARVNVKYKDQIICE